MKTNREPLTNLESLLEGEIQNGYSPLPVENKTGCWVLGLGALTASGLDLSQIKPIAADEGKFADKVLQDGDFLVSRSNTREKVGLASCFKGGIVNCIYPDLMMRFRPDQSVVSSDYLDQFLRSPIAKRYFSRKAAGTSASMVKITKSTLAKLPVFLPILPEQNAIADILSTWDEAIEKTERLIELKLKLFKRLRKHLIFDLATKENGYRTFCLNEVCEAVNRKNSLAKTNVLTSSAKKGLVSQLDYYKKSVSSENVTGYYLLKKGEFAYNRSSAKGYPYGAIKRLDNYEQGVLSTLYLCFSINKHSECDSNYLLHFFESGALNRQLRAVCNEGARSHGLLNILKSDFFSLEVSLPEVIRQKEISGQLNIAKLEINLLKKLLLARQQQKRGLMQKLLTGTWRVPVKEEAIGG